MGIKATFNKLIGRGPKTLDKISVMSTKKLPIPDFADDHYFIQFKAKKNKKSNKWEISSHTNCNLAIDGIDISEKIFNVTRATIAESDTSTHMNGKSSGYLLNLNSTFICLDVLEKIINDYDKDANDSLTKKEEPKDYFKKALQLAPDNMQKTTLSKSAQIATSVKSELSGNNQQAIDLLPVKRTKNKPMN